MKLILRIALSLAAFGPLAAAHAADYDPPIVIDDAAEYVPVEVGSGWYLRGDVGYIFDASIGQVDYRTFDGLTYGSARLRFAGYRYRLQLGRRLRLPFHRLFSSRRNGRRVQGRLQRQHVEHGVLLPARSCL